MCVYDRGKEYKYKLRVCGGEGPWIIPCLALGEFPLFQHMKHEVSTTYVFHHKEQMVLGLKAGVKACEEWWLVLQGQNPALIKCALHIILLHHNILLQTLNSIHFLRRLVFSKKHLHVQEVCSNIGMCARVYEDVYRHVCEDV